MNYPFDAVRLDVLALLLFAAMALAAWGGNRLRRGRGSGVAAVQADAVEGYVLSAALALLGLLIAFTFSLAVSRYDARRALVVQEGNAIGTTWLRSTLATGPGGAALRHEIRTYTDVRLGIARGEDTAAVRRATDAGQKRVWTAMRRALPELQPPIAATLVTATNAMFDAAEARKVERDARIPAEVLGALLAYAGIAAGILGYVMAGSAGRHRVVTGLLFVLLSFALTLIIDLDRPGSGAITVSQAPLYDARAAME